MDFLLWTCLVLGLLGAISLALGGLGLESADSVASAGDVAELGEVLDLADAGDLTDALESHEAFADSHAAFHAHAAHLELTQVAQVLDQHSGAGSRLPDAPVPRMKPVSSFTIFGFLAGFGVVGLGLRYGIADLPQAVILGGGLTGGFLLAWILWRLLDRMMQFVESNSTLTERDYLGVLAETTIPMEVGAIGEVAFEVGGRRQTGPARNTTGQPLGRRAKVRLAGREGAFFRLSALTREDLDFLLALGSLEATLDQEPDRQTEAPAQADDRPTLTH